METGYFPPLSVTDSRVRITPSILFWLEKCEVGFYLAATGCKSAYSGAMLRGSCVGEGIRAFIERGYATQAAFEAAKKHFFDNIDKLDAAKVNRDWLLAQINTFLDVYLRTFEADLRLPNAKTEEKRLLVVGGVEIGCRADIFIENRLVIENKTTSARDSIMLVPLSVQANAYPPAFGVTEIKYNFVLSERKQTIGVPVFLRRDIVRCLDYLKRRLEWGERALNEPVPASGMMCTAARCGYWKGACPYGECKQVFRPGDHRASDADNLGDLQ